MTDDATAAISHIVDQFPRAVVRYVEAINPDSFHLSASETGSLLFLHPSREPLVTSVIGRRSLVPLEHPQSRRE